MACEGKHIKNPIPEDGWKCPKCGAGGDYFAIWDSIYPECELDHPDDIASCEKCGYSASMETVTRNYWKKQSMVKCPHCNGTGLIKEEKK